MFSSSRARAITISAPAEGDALVIDVTALLTTGTKAGSGLVCSVPPSDLVAAWKAARWSACWPIVVVANALTTGLAELPPM